MRVSKATARDADLTVPSDWPPGPSYTHYVHIDDPVATGLGIGRDKEETAKRGGTDADGNPAKVIIFSGEPGGPYETEKPVKGIPEISHHYADSSYLPMMSGPGPKPLPPIVYP